MRESIQEQRAAVAVRSLTRRARADAGWQTEFFNFERKSGHHEQGDNEMAAGAAGGGSGFGTGGVRGQ